MTERVDSAPLPYRRVAQVPPAPDPITWRFAYHCTAGVFSWELTVDGVPIDGRGQSSTSQDIIDDVSS